MICKNCGKDIKDDSTYCEFCGAIIKKSENLDASTDLLKVKRRNNVRLMADISLAINLCLTILFTFLTFYTKNAVKNCMLIFAFVCLSLFFAVLIIKHVKLNKIEDKKNKK